MAGGLTGGAAGTWSDRFEQGLPLHGGVELLEKIFIMILFF